MDLETKFKKETGFDAYADNDLRPKVPSDYYVEWLEEQLTIGGVSNWVAVTEKLPLVNGFYLVYIDGLTEEKALFKNNEFHVREETLTDMEVTHWMHLPKPPCY